jgi:hypothetical protein
VEIASEYHPGINGIGVRFLEKTGAVSGAVYFFSFWLVLSNSEFWIETYITDKGNLAFGHIYNDYNFLCERLTEDLNQDLTTKDIEDPTNPLAILDYWTREYTCPYRPYMTPFKTATKIPENEKTLIFESASQLSAIP